MQAAADALVLGRLSNKQGLAEAQSLQLRRSIQGSHTIAAWACANKPFVILPICIDLGPWCLDAGSQPLVYTAETGVAAAGWNMVDEAFGGSRGSLPLRPPPFPGRLRRSIQRDAPELHVSVCTRLRY